jgi:2-methylcitrate dehydratase
MDAPLIRLAEEVAGFDPATLAPEAQHDAQRRILDTLGCALAAHAHPAVQAARRVAMLSAEQPGATILGTAHRTSPELAAFANAVAGRVLEGNDAYPGGGGHPSDAILPLLGLAESLDADGAALIDAVWIAYQMHFAMFRDLRLREHGLDHTLYNAMATAAGAARLLRLDVATTRHALALALTANLALHATRIGALSMWKGCAAANAARGGIFAARLAAAGMTGPERPLDGHHGLLELIGPRAIGGMLGGPDAMRTRAAHKALLTEYHAQGPILALLSLGVTAAQVARIEVFTYWFTWSEIGSGPEKWRPETPEAADHSLPYMIAAVLVDGGFDDAIFAPARLADPRIAAVMARVRVTEDPMLTARFPRAYPCRVEVTLQDGSVLRAGLDNPPGHPDNPMDDAAMAAKFRMLAGRLLPQARVAQALDWLGALPQQASLRALPPLLRAADQASAALAAAAPASLPKTAPAIRPEPPG